MQFGQHRKPTELADMNRRETLTSEPLREELPSWGVLVLESHHSPEFTMRWRSHQFLKLLYVLCGAGELHTHADQREFQRGDLIVVPPATQNRIVDRPGAEPSLYVCCIDKSLFDFDHDLLSQFKLSRIRSSKATETLVAAILRRMVFTQAVADDGCSISMVADAIHLARVVLNHQPGPQHSAVNPDAPADDLYVRYAEDLRRNFYEVSTIDAAAESMGVSRRAFTTGFAKATGTTWLKYVRRLAIDHAKDRLAETSLPVTSVAFECGFADLSTFYRQFNRQCGMSPAAYRNRMATKSE